MKAQILADIGQKLRSCDQVIKESIMNVTSSKVTCVQLKLNFRNNRIFFCVLGINGHVWECRGCGHPGRPAEDLHRHIENDHYSVL